jgi:hypothetical protein
VIGTNGIEPSPIVLVRGRPVTRGVRLKLRVEEVDRLPQQTIPLLTKALIAGEELGELALARSINPK